jgi:hypothetical protein
VAAGRSWNLAKAAQLIRKDDRPHRWVALQLDKRALGLFWAGLGYSSIAVICWSLRPATSNPARPWWVPVTPEALLRLVLDLEAERAVAARNLSRINPRFGTQQTLLDPPRSQ